jgi:hypothetical protein
LERVGKSFIKIRKRMGLSTHPWGVPFSGQKEVEWDPFTTTSADLFSRKFLM